MTWKAGDESTLRGYKFTYDGLDRLLNVVYGETASISMNTNRFSENVTAYDKNGNIKSLQRYGQTSASTYGLIDSLTFTLNGNRPSRVNDAATASAYGNGFEFKDGAKQADEYAYDANGNLTKDLNKGITDISYNCLNLPIYFSFKTGGFLQHGYTADGVRRRTIYKELDDPTNPVITVYCGNVIYENNVPRLLLHEEGYVDLTDNSYHYYVKDHQGNNCLVVDSSGAVEEANHYYPFGGVFASTGNVQPYKYNGKELDTEKGLNWYDYGARMYDPALGRFHTNDRFAEKYLSMSPYQYGANNPVNCIDINGDSIIINNDNLIDFVSAVYNGVEDGRFVIRFNNGVLDPASIERYASESSDFFLKDLYEIASNEKMVEISFSDKNTYKMNGRLFRDDFEKPVDINTHSFGELYDNMLQMNGFMTGKVIEGDLGQTLVPGYRGNDKKGSVNSNVQVLINGKGTLNQRTVGLAHEFGHVILYLRNLPFGHGQNNVDPFVYRRNDDMMRRLGYGK